MKTIFKPSSIRRVSALPWLLLAALALLMSSCGDGVTQEELDAEKARVASLEAKVEEAEIQMALVQSQLAQQSTEAADLRNAVDQAEAREAMLAAFLAWNRKDAETFLSSFTDRGLASSVLSLPQSIGDMPIGLRRVMDVEVSGDTAHVQVMSGLGTHRNSVRHSLVKTGEGWKIDGEERLSPKIKGATIAVDTRLDGCSLEAGDRALTTGNVAFKVENAGAVARNLALVQIADELDLTRVVDGPIPGEAVIDVLAHVSGLQPGETTNVAFTAPLGAGRYALICTGPADAGQGVVAGFAVP